MAIQEFEWGYVEWFDECIDSLNIGISHVKCGAVQRPHIHYENEQWIYVLQGVGKHMIDEEERKVQAGDNLYLPFNCIHSTSNLGDSPLVELVISSPRKNSNIKVREFSLDHYAMYQNSLNAAIDALNLDYNCPNDIPFIIVDEDLNIVYKSKAFKKLNQNTNLSITNEQRDGEIRIPLKVDDQLIGHIFCDLNILQEKNFKNMSESSANSIKSFLGDLSSSISSFYKFNNLQKNFIEHKNDHIFKSIDEEDQVIENRKSNSNNLKINFHFLFNTLNYMASLALEQDNEELYTAIIVLGKLFRYISDNTGKMISIKEELDYLKNYIYLQKIRFKENLTVLYDIDEELLNSEIPINCLQPVIENAFSHGFMKYYGEKVIEIKIKQAENDRINIFLKNNGRQMDMSTVKKIQESLGNGENHGLMLVYDKLKLNYGDDFQLKLYLEDEKMVVQIEIPNRKILC